MSFRVRPSAILANSRLATGPHLHYEVIINGNFVDPMAIKLPRTREFDGRMLASFKRERDRIDQLMAEIPSRRGDGDGKADIRRPSQPLGASTEFDCKPAVGARAEPQRCANFARGQTRRAQFGQRPGLTALRQFRSVPVENQPVVPVARLGNAEESLQRAVDRGRGKQVPPPHHVGYALQRVVHDDGQMVACRKIAASKDNVAPNLRRRRMLKR